MKLYLHIGTEKTGSSFIQTTLGQAREQLQTHHLFFPSAGKLEKELQAGRISAGNGAELQLLLLKQDFVAVKKLLNAYSMEAKNSNCEGIVLSNELLFEELGNERIIVEFLKILKTLELNLQPLLLVVRNPIDQALSLYQHRSKSGTTPLIQEWLKKGYVVPEKLAHFLDSSQNLKLPLRIRKYKMDSAYLIDDVLAAWLNLSESIPWKDQRVNPSLTLSELEVLKKYHVINSDYVPFLYQKFVEIPRSQKAKDVFLKSQFKKVIEKEVQNYQEVWKRINTFLEPDEYLITSVNDAIVSGEKPEYSFSDTQLDVLIQFQDGMNSIGFKIEVYRQKIRKILSYFWHEIILKVKR